VLCSEWIMDTKIDVVKLRGKERHECNRDTYICSFAPHLSTSYITREEQDKRNTADLEAGEVRIRHKRALYEPPPVLIKKIASKNKTVRVVKRETHKESRSASNPASRSDNTDVATGRASTSVCIRPSHSSAGVSTPAPTHYQSANPKRLVFSAAAKHDATASGELLFPRCASVAAAAATHDATASGELLFHRCASVAAAAAASHDGTTSDQQATLKKSASMVKYLRQELREMKTKEYGWIAANTTLETSTTKLANDFRHCQLTREAPLARASEADCKEEVRCYNIMILSKNELRPSSGRLLV
jgi:hypothetical protein